MQKIHYAYLLLFFLFTSCGFDIKDNTRMVFTGSVTDNTGKPIPNIPVFLGGMDAGRKEVLGKARTDNLGMFRAISLKTQTNNFYINRQKDYYQYRIEDKKENSDPVFTAVDFINVPGSMNLGTITLRRKATLNFKINKTSTSNDTLYWKLSYTHRSCQKIFYDGFLQEEESSCYEFFSDNSSNEQSPTEFNFENTYKTILGGTAEFTYRIDQEPAQTITLNIDQPNVTYVFEY